MKSNRVCKNFVRLVWTVVKMFTVTVEWRPLASMSTYWSHLLSLEDTGENLRVAVGDGHVLDMPSGQGSTYKGPLASFTPWRTVAERAFASSYIYPLPNLHWSKQYTLSSHLSIFYTLVTHIFSVFLLPLVEVWGHYSPLRTKRDTRYTKIKVS